ISHQRYVVTGDVVHDDPHQAEHEEGHHRGSDPPPRYGRAALLTGRRGVVVFATTAGFGHGAVLFTYNAIPVPHRTLPRAHPWLAHRTAVGTMECRLFVQA